MADDRPRSSTAPAGSFAVTELLDVQEAAIVSRTLVDRESGTVTVFAFDEGQRLSEHSAPHDAVFQTVAGVATVTLDGEVHRVESGDAIVLPAAVPHAVEADTAMHVILTMIR